MAGIIGTIKTVKRALTAAAGAVDPGEYRVAGIQIQCLHCRGRKFNESPNLGGGVNLVCRKCHLVHWFAKRPDEV